MEFVNIDNELTPRVMYKPYIYSTITPISIGYICKTPKGYKTFITPGAYEKGDDVLVRDPNRIEPFMYKDINQEFYNKNEEQQKKELVKIQNEFNKNKLKMEELYKKTANKLEYNGIYNVCLEILKEIK